MDAGIVELNALAYAYGPGAQHHDRLSAFALGRRPLFPDKLSGLVLPAAFGGIVGGVEIGGMGGKFASAGIHHLEGGLALIVHLTAGEPCYSRVRIAQPLALGVQLLCEGPIHKLPLVVQKVYKL